MDPGERAELLLEQQDRGAVDVAQRLERDLLAGLAIVRLVHHAHAAHAELTDQLEALGSRELARVQQLSGCYAGQGGGFLAAHALPTCTLCEATCGVAIEVEGDRVVSVRGDEADPFSKGYICPKGTALADLHSRSGSPAPPDACATATTWREIGWDEAFDLVARAAARRSARAHGADAIAVYQGNPTAHNLGLLTYGQLLLRTLGTQNMYSATSLDQLPHMLAALHDVRQPAADAGARHRSHRSVHLPRRESARVERQHHDRARHARPAQGDPRARRQGRSSLDPRRTETAEKRRPAPVHPARAPMRCCCSR